MVFARLARSTKVFVEVVAPIADTFGKVAGIEVPPDDPRAVAPLVAVSVPRTCRHVTTGGNPEMRFRIRVVVAIVAVVRGNP
jgi:hypothetical protein